MNQIRQGVVAVSLGQPKGDDGRRLFFLFSARQVEEVLGTIRMRPVPFAPPSLLGMAQWRGHLLPVVELETSLFGAENDRQQNARFMVLRSGARDEQGQGRIVRCIVRISGEIRPMNVTDSSSVDKSDVPGLDTSCVRSVYGWEDSTYIVPDFVSILMGY